MGLVKEHIKFNTPAVIVLSLVCGGGVVETGSTVVDQNFFNLSVN